MFPPIFPIYIRQLSMLHAWAPLVWLGGVVCLWLTRYTHQLAGRWGKTYYGLSMLIRPAGIILISLGWLALFAPAPEYIIPGGLSTGWLPARSWTNVLCWLAILLFFALGVWSVVVLGVRQSFFYRKLEDGLITSGPYSLVRHPQFLSAIGITFFTVQIFNPAEYLAFVLGAYYHSLFANWALFSLSLWGLAILEERELRTHFGEEYETYTRRVARLFPI